MSKSTYETWCVEKGTRNGKPYSKRYPLGVPLAVARGHLEKLSNLQLRELGNDVAAEQRRREQT